MIIKKIRLKNIRSYAEEEVEFPQGSSLISGDIGSGKTSLLLAIEYALFGLQPGQKGSSLLRNSSQDGEVDLEFEISGRRILIERRLKRTQKGVSNEYAAITIDGDKTESSVTEVKSKVIQLLGYPPEFVKKNNVLYRYTVHSPQEQMKQIILEDPESRINILRNIFGIDRYKQIKENLSVLLNNLKSSSKLLQGEVGSLEKDLEELALRKSGLKYIEEKISEKSSELREKSDIKDKTHKGFLELKEKLREKETLEKEVDKTKILVATKRELLFSIGSELEELRGSIAEAGEPFNNEVHLSLLKETENKKKELESLNLDYLNIVGKINSLQQEKTNISEKKERIFRIDICPTCLQDVSETHKHNILNATESSMVKIKKNLDELEGKEKVLSSRIDATKNQITALEEKKIFLEILKSRLQQTEKSKQKLGSLQKQKLALEQDALMLAKHIDSLKEKILRYSPLDYQLRKKEEELENASTEEKKAEIAVAELKKELELSNREIFLFEQKIAIKENSKRRLRSLEEKSNWLSNQFLNLIELIERNVLLNLRSEFSKLFRKWFLMLVPENSLESHIDENFTPVIVQGENEMDYSFLSGGERTAAALAYRLALNQTINSFAGKIKTQGIIILDEPTDGFSEAQIEKIRDILEELSTEQLILVSHEQKIEGFVDNVLRVVKEGDISSVLKQAHGLPKNLNTFQV